MAKLRNFQWHTKTRTTRTSRKQTRIRGDGTRTVREQEVVLLTCSTMMNLRAGSLASASTTESSVFITHAPCHAYHPGARAGEYRCTTGRATTVLRAEGAAHGPVRGPFFRAVPPVQPGRAGPAHSPTSISCLNLPFFLNKGQFFSQITEEAAYNFIVISKRKSTKSQHIEQNERAVSGHGPTGLGHHRAVGRGCGPWPASTGPGRATDRAKFNGPNVHLYW